MVGLVAALLAGVRPDLAERAEFRTYDVRVAASASSTMGANGMPGGEGLNAEIGNWTE